MFVKAGSLESAIKDFYGVNPTDVIKRTGKGSWVRILKPYLPSGPVRHYQMGESIPNLRGAWCTISFYFYFKIEKEI